MQGSQDWSLMRAKARLVKRRGLLGSFWMLEGWKGGGLVRGGSGV